MNQTIIKNISAELKVNSKQVESALNLLKEGSTIPFIARYRKEATGNLDEDQLNEINKVYEYQVNLAKRKEDVIRLIDEKGLLTKELEEEISKATKLVDVEDLYLPFKEKKKTKATEAIKLGLEPLAKEIMTFGNKTIDELVKPFVNEKLSKEKAIEGAGFIIAEMISDNAKYRKALRFMLQRNGYVVTKVKKTHGDEKGTYERYYEFREAVNKIKPYQVLAINRAEKEKVITVNTDINTDDLITYLESEVITNNNSPVVELVKSSIADSYKRLIFPSLSREIRSELTEVAEDASLVVFSDNLEHLLLTPPMKEKVVLGFDPAFRTGCKLAVLSKTGKLLKTSVIYPHEPQRKVEASKNELLALINEFKIDIIAIGNGTASRESETLVAEFIKENKLDISYVIVNESGASVYSASKVAQDEFPTLSVEERSAVSIGRRLQDPLNELVKIDTKSIGVGQYQHDITPKKLNSSLDFVVEKCVNSVGVNINTASSSILKFVSGLTKPNITKLLKQDKFNSRREVEKVLSPKAYEQAIGFLRILEGDNPLDATSIHPESYGVAIKLLALIKMDIDKIGTEELKLALSKLDIAKIATTLGTDNYTLEDIINDLSKPNRDPRDEYPAPVLKSDVLNIEDLSIGMELEGIVRNVVDFGAFIDIGLKNDGMAHISKLSKNFVKHPSDIVKVGDIVKCYVVEVDKTKDKVALSLLKDKT